MVSKKTSIKIKRFPTWSKVAIGIFVLVIFSVGIAFVSISFILIGVLNDKKAEKNIDLKFHQEISNIPEIKVNSFKLWESDSIVNIDIQNKGSVHFWYGRNNVPRIDAIGNVGISQVCYYVDRNGTKIGYAGDVSLVLDKDQYYKKWFSFEVINLQDLVNRYDEIVKIVSTFPKNPETEVFHDKLWGDRYVVKNPDPNFIVYRKIDNKEVTCDLFQSY